MKRLKENSVVNTGLQTWCQKWDYAMAHLKRPELKLVGNVSENFKNFELRFNDYCIQTNYRNLAKNPRTERADHYKSPLLEISALRSALPDEALSVLRYTIEPQISADDKTKPWIWMDKLRAHYAGSTGSSLLTDRFKFWTSSQAPNESIQEWEVKVRQAGSLCAYGARGGSILPFEQHFFICLTLHKKNNRIKLFYM